jgi:hypothetical protein
MIRKLRDKEVATTETTGRRNVRILFEDSAVAEVLKFIEKTKVGKRLAGAPDKADMWDIKRRERW